MLTELQRRKQRNLFALHDLNGDGAIQEDDWETYTRNICAAKGVEPGSPEYDAILTAFAAHWQDLKAGADAGGDGGIDFDGWCSFMGEVVEDEGRYERIVDPIVRAVFAMLDRDGDGVITEDEYVAIWQAGAHDASGAPEVYARLVGDGGKGMSIDDMRGLVERFFRSQDPDEPANSFFGPLGP